MTGSAAPATAERSLTRLVGPVGLRYLRCLLPPGWLALGVLALATLWMAASAHDLVAFTACAVAFAGVLVYWPRRSERRWPWVRLSVLVLLLCLELSPPLAHLPTVRNGLYALAVLSIVQALRHLLQAGWMSVRLQRSASALSDAHLLALLPPEAREDALRWQGGDDSKSAELGQVVQLTALWLAMRAVGACGPEPSTHAPM